MTATKVICEFFGSLGLEVTAEQLRDPSADQVRTLYEVLVRYAFELDDKNYVKDVAAVAHDAGAIHYERAYSLIKTVNLVALLCKDLDLFKPGEQFNYGDVISPTRDRTRHVLHNIIQYIDYKNAHAFEVQQVYTELEDRDRELQSDRFARDTAKHNVERSRQEVDAAKRKKNEHMRHCVELRQKVCERKTEATKVEDLLIKKRDEFNALEESLKQARADLAKARDKNRALEANIVRSPDKLHAEIRRMEDELQAAITGCDNTTKLLLEMESDVKKQEEIEHAVNSLREELQQLETEWGGQAQLHKDSDAMAKKVEKARSALRKLEEERQQIVAELSAKRQKLELWHSGKRHEQHIYREQIAKLKPAIAEIEERERQEREEGKELRRHIDLNTRALGELDEKYDRDLAKLTESLLTIKKYMDTRTAEVSKSRKLAHSLLAQV